MSLDYVGEEYSAIIDTRWIDIIDKKLVKLVLWYDNEFGYTAQLLGLAKEMVGLTYQRYPNFSEST